jgi:hypothetical protein
MRLPSNVGNAELGKGSIVMQIDQDKNALGAPGFMHGDSLDYGAGDQLASS